MNPLDLVQSAASALGSAEYGPITAIGRAAYLLGQASVLLNDGRPTPPPFPPPAPAPATP